MDRNIERMLSESFSGDEQPPEDFLRQIIDASLDGKKSSKNFDFPEDLNSVSRDDFSKLIARLLSGFQHRLESTRNSYEEKIDRLKAYTSAVEQTSKLVGRQNLVLSYFYQASRMISSSLDRDLIISMIVEMMSNIFESSICCVFNVHDDGRIIIPGGIRPSIPEFSDYFRGNVEMSVGQGCEGKCIEDQVPFQVKDVFASPHYKNFVHLAKEFGFKSVLSVPLFIREKVNGCIAIYSRQERFFAEEDVRILSMFADQAALTMENARLYQQTDEKLKQRVRELSLIHTLDQAIINNHDLDSISRIFMSSLENVFTGCDFILDLTKIDQGRCICSKGLEKAGNDCEELKRMIDGKFTNKLESILKGKINGKPIQFITYPIRYQKDYAGVLTVISYDDHLKDQEITRFLKGIVSQLSIAIEKSKTLEKLIQSEKMNVLGSLISGVAHELNSPLSRILSMAESYSPDGDPREAKNYFDMIIEESLRCKNIIEGFLVFARKYKKERKPVSVKQVIIKTLQLWKYQKKADDMIVRTEFAENLPLVNLNSNRIEQVFINLIVNAYHALAENADRTKILMIKTFFKSDHVHVVFQDNGPGITDEVKERIFQPFFTTKEEGKGTGLGLSICRDIVKDHGGDITLKSEMGKGAKFIIRFPVEVEKKKKRKHKKKSAAKKTKSGTVLVADDDFIILKLVSKFLKKSGFKVAPVSDGKTCLDKALSGNYDVIISDMYMPGLAGDAVIEALMEKRCDLLHKLILCTGDILKNDELKRFEDHGVRIIYKPFEMAELMKIVQEVMNNGDSAEAEN